MNESDGNRGAGEASAQWQITRRLFLRGAAAAAGLAGLSLPTANARGEAAAAAAAADPGKHLYSFPLLGDIHYDRMNHHDLDWVRKEKGNDLRQIEGYAKNTAERTPRLLDRVRETVAASTVPVPFVIQVGDLVEGLCGSFDLQSLQFKDAIAAVEAARLGAPFLVTKGNHDVTGPGAPRAFDEVLLPWLATQSRAKEQTANYALRHADDRFVFFDAYKPDLDWLDRTLAAPADRARRTFVVVHPPVVPYNARSNWHLFANPKDAPSRKRLLALLAEHRALVLGGHLHRYAIVERQVGAAGRFTQLAVSSVLTTDTPRPRDELAGPDHYTPDELLNTEPGFSADTTDKRRQLIGDESPAITRYEYADLPGFAMLHVHERAVRAELHAGLAQRPWRTRTLTPTTA